MAGYIFLLDAVEALRMYAHKGVYATKIGAPRGYWGHHHEGAFADYISMKPGDNVYFFIDRKVYGIGEMVRLGTDCKFKNYSSASEPRQFEYEAIKPELLWDEGQESVNQRWLCVFRPSPYFFSEGIDMDDVLSSRPASFRMLRALWKVSFIKFDDEENQAFKDALLKANQNVLSAPVPGGNTFQVAFEEKHQEIQNVLGRRDYSLTVSPILHHASRGDVITHEMALEAGILSQLANEEAATTQVFGRWNYLSHQVVASPFKPVDYMDKMDLFGYRYIGNYAPTKSAYLVAELKKDSAIVENVEQVMKYVDWVKDEYAYGDYGMITAVLVAYDFPQEVIDAANTTGWRRYIIGRRPAQSLEWRSLRLVRYRYDRAQSLIQFQQL